MAKQTVNVTSNNRKQNDVQTKELELEKDPFYNKLDLQGKVLCKNYLANNQGSTTEEFYIKRQQAKKDRKTTPISGTPNYDGTVVVGATKDDVVDLHHEAKRFARETGNG